MASVSVEETHDLQLLSIIGFDGQTIHGLKVHPDGVHVLYPLGCKVAIVEWDTQKQSFLEGHTNIITAVAVSPDGRYVGSGQINHMGFKALVILWDFEKKVALLKHDIHKVRVEALDFSSDSVFLYSLGGRDDGNIVATHIPSLEPMCGYSATRATSGEALTLKHTYKRGNVFMSAGENSLRVWQVNAEKRNVRAMDVQLNKVKRHIFCISIDTKDEFAYCGTLTGDILKVALYFPADTNLTEPIRNPNLTVCLGKVPLTKKKNAEAERYKQGVRDILILEWKGKPILIVGAGDGTVEMVFERETGFKDSGRLKMPSYPLLNLVQRAFVGSTVTSLNLFRAKDIMVGTALCEIHLIDIESFFVRLVITCHTSCIYDLAFPKNYSEVFATASKNDIRVWHTESCKELLRISVPNFTCSTVKFTADGKSIISGWNDGCIRAFTPQSGRLIYTVPNAHNKGVTALDVTSCGKAIVTGGGEGQVRVWKMTPTTHVLAAIMKDHKGPVSDIHISSNNLLAVSSSTDGSAILWDIVRLVRLQILFANSLFMACRFNPDGCQVLTAGTDRKVQYWECFDGSLIRDLEGSTAAALNSLDISQDGRYFVTGSNDFLVKVWNYNEGFTTHIGVGHAGIITAVRFSPDSQYLISVSDDGAIFTWKCPFAPDPGTRIESARSPNADSIKISSDQGVESKVKEAKTTTMSTPCKMGSGDGTNEENIVALSTPRSNRCSARGIDQPPQIESDPSLVSLTAKPRTGCSSKGSGSASLKCQQTTIPPIKKYLHRQVGKISSASEQKVPKDPVLQLATCVKSETNQNGKMEKPSSRT